MAIQTALPETGFVRLPLILSVIPVGRTTWWEGVRDKKFPPSYKIGKITVWRAEDIRKLINDVVGQ
jgi:prophage regulatory protein